MVYPVTIVIKNCVMKKLINAEKFLPAQLLKDKGFMQILNQKCVANEIGQRRRADKKKLLKADRKVTVTQITSHYNSGMQKNISEHTMHQTSLCILQDYCYPLWRELYILTEAQYRTVLLSDISRII